MLFSFYQSHLAQMCDAVLLKRLAYAVDLSLQVELLAAMKNARRVIRVAKTSDRIKRAEYRLTRAVLAAYRELI